jgi:hypothetical protein
MRVLGIADAQKKNVHALVQSEFYFIIVQCWSIVAPSSESKAVDDDRTPKSNNKPGLYNEKSQLRMGHFLDRGDLDPRLPFLFHFAPFFFTYLHDKAGG